jgi:hypothetical protein
LRRRNPLVEAESYTSEEIGAISARSFSRERAVSSHHRLETASSPPAQSGIQWSMVKGDCLPRFDDTPANTWRSVIGATVAAEAKHHRRSRVWSPRLITCSRAVSSNVASSCVQSITQASLKVLSESA